MAIKWLIPFIIVILFISGCFIGDKTKGVVSDVGEEAREEVTGAVVEEEQKIKDTEKSKISGTTHSGFPTSKSEDFEELEDELIQEENETVQEEPIEETEINESEGDETEEELPPGTHIITIKDLKLNPQELTIKKGDTVIWKHEDKWEDDTKHLLAEHSNEFRNKQYMYYGGTFNHTFNKTGVFTYFDILYPDKNYMRGKITVTE